MRFYIVSLFIVLQSCGVDVCQNLDATSFKPEIDSQYCSAFVEDSIEEELCLKKNSYLSLSFFEKYGVDRASINLNFKKHQEMIDDEMIKEFGTALLGDAIAHPNEPFSKDVANFLLSKGVDPFKSDRTVMAPVGWIVESIKIGRMQSEYYDMWDLVKTYYPPNEYEVAGKVDLYIRNCVD